MDIKFKNNGSIYITTIDYLKEAIADFGKPITSPATTPVNRNLFNVDPDAVLLEEEQADIFHSIVAKLLFVARRSRLDIGLAIAFLCTHVSNPTVQDWEKLCCVLRYIYGTIKMPQIIKADNLSILKTWVDASYAIHDDMRSHTGGVVGFDGLGIISMKSTKQKLNTKSSTEAKVIGASDFLPWTLCTSHFLKEQGYHLDSSIFYQDNQSTIKLERNGLQSSGEKTRHIDIRYFFINDIIKCEHIDIHYYLTEKMIADFYTKPLQGTLFKTLRDHILGCGDFISSKERIEENNCLDETKQPEKATYASIVMRGINDKVQKSEQDKTVKLDLQQTNKKRMSVEKPMTFT